MHFFPAVVTFAAFWAILPVKLVAVAGFVYVIVAALKARFPLINGKYSLILNIVFSACGVLGFAKPEELADPHFWAGLVLTIASASGIHGTVKAASEPRQTSNPGIGSQATRALALLVIAGTLVLAGCQRTVTAAPPPPLPAAAVDQIDATAYKTLKPANNFAASMSDDIKAGRLTPGPNLTLALESLNRALNMADHAEQSYHRAGGGDAAALNASVAAALNAWASAQAALNLQGK